LCHGSVARRHEPRKQIGKDGYTARVKRSLVFTAGLLPSEENADKRGRALLILSGLLGAINLSRAVSDPILSREILDQVRQQLVDLTAGNALSKRGAGLKQQEPKPIHLVKKLVPASNGPCSRLVFRNHLALLAHSSLQMRASDANDSVLSYQNK